jgi:hypothetical protein
MDSAVFSDLTLLEINQSIGLPLNFDFLLYIEKYDNEVPIMDRNYNYTSYFNIYDTSYVIVISSDAYKRIINKTEEEQPVLRLIKTKKEYASQDKLDKSKLMFNNSSIMYYDIMTTNVYVNYLNDEEGELYEEFDKADRSYPEMNYDIPYLGLPEDEQEIGHWNID